MSIRYVLVGKDMKTNLADYAADKGQYQLAIQELLKKLKPNRRKAYTSKDCMVYTYCTESLQFMCITDKQYKIEVAYNFLEAVKKALYGKYTEQQINDALSASESFGPVLKALVDEYNLNPEDPAKKVIADLQELNNQTSDNLSMFLP